MALSNLDFGVDSIKTAKFIEEISIIIAAQDLSPTIMSQDFLKFSGIVPKDWELSQPPVLNPNFAQINFKNGLSFTAQPRTVTIGETLNGKNLNDIQAPKIVAKYIEKLPHAEYMGLSFGPKMLLPFPKSPQNVRQYITGTLLGSGAWKEIGKAPVQAGVNLMYLLDRCQLTISVSEARLQQSQKPEISALLFAGNFNYNFDKNQQQEQRVKQLVQALNYWHTDLKAFREIVTEKFLNAASDSDFGQSVGTQSVFPANIL